MKIPTLIYLTAIVSLTSAIADEFHQFTDTKGRKLEAKVVGLEGDQVTIERRDGKSFTVARTIFSAADQTVIDAFKPAPVPAAAGGAAPKPTSDIDLETINTALGHPVFADTHLWDDSPDETATRLKWRRESKTDFVSSYRQYPRNDFRFLGARPFSAALYGDDGAVTSISLVFANKGDSFAVDRDSKGTGDEDVLEQLNEAIEADISAISKVLTEATGEEGDRQRFGEGSGRQTVTRWNWNDHAFLLFEQEDEYVSLEIQPRAFADAGGKVERIKEVEIRARARGNVETRENGDVVVKNIPMVDQGPKGYCVPATFERTMRYLGVPADMYLLAMAGETGIGGGTSVGQLVDAISDDVRRKGRGFDRFDGDVEIRKLAKYIDEGIPVMWTMYSTDEFNETATQRTEMRKSVDDWSDWAAQLEKEVKDKELQPNRDRAHVTLIVGYNKETGEIAFSDSWGERYLERWVHAEEATEISQGGFSVVTF